VLKVNRTAYRYEPVKLPDEDEVVEAVIDLGTNFGRLGYRRVTQMLHGCGKQINHKRVERIWKQEGLKRPKKQQKRRRIFLNDGSCVRLRPEHKNHVWSWDFVEDKDMQGKKMRFLNIIDEHEHKCLASIPRRSWRSRDVIRVLSDIIVLRGTGPEYIRSDNGPEFIAKALRKWIHDIGSIITYIEPGSPWENGYIESFNARMRDEFLNGELFGNLHEARILTQRWVNYYNNIRPHSSLKGRPPAPQSYNFDALEPTATLKQKVWEIIRQSEQLAAA